MDIIVFEIDGRLRPDPGTRRIGHADVIAVVVSGRIEFHQVAKARPANSPAVCFSRLNP
jgi:hypothetical protein